MANLVSPGYKESRLINTYLAPMEERIIEFKGLNRRDYVEEGEMSDMKNLTSDNYPLLTPRKLRGTYTLPTGVDLPLHIMTRYEKIALIALDENEHVNFYYDGTKVNSVTGLDESTTMVAINTKICFFPQKTYLELVRSGSTVTIGSFGHLDETAKTTASSNSFAIAISNEDARLTLNASHNFGYDDAIDITGTLSYTDANNVAQTKLCTVSCIIEEVSGNTLVLPRETFIELTGEGATNITLVGVTSGQTYTPAVVSRDVPDLTHIVEWNNRLWGASDSDNTIYACKLGDPKNWKYFQGTSLDSYYAQQGTDGVWTGSAPYSSHLIFFKQASMTRIYGTAPSNFQVTNAQCFGVEEGDEKSIAIVNDRVFYKSINGIMVYEGGTPYCISEKLNTRYKHAVGGTEGNKYYFCGQSSLGGYDFLVLDVDKGLWHREDGVHMWEAATVDNKLYFIRHYGSLLVCSTQNVCSEWLNCSGGATFTGDVQIVNPVHATETNMDWSATFGPFDEYIENRKIYSKILLRLIRKKDSWVKVYISIDEGAWEQVYEFNPATTGGDYIPIIPRRCDRYSIKVEGRGEVAIKSLTRKVRRGTGGRL